MAAIRSSVWYINFGDGSTTGYYAVPVWATATVYTAGTIVRPTAAPAVGNERLYVCCVSGTSTTEPTWTYTKGVINAGTLESFQECTGQPGVNGDATNTPAWTASNSFTLGQVITNAAGTGWFICKVSGTSNSSQPAGLTTPVVNAATTDNTATWTCIKTSAYAGWAAPHARVANALTATWGAAGDDFYIASASAETQASAITLTFPGTSAAPNRLFSVTAAGSVPPVAADLTAGAAVTTTGANAQTITAFVYMYGVSFNIGTGTSAANFNPGNGAASAITFDTCAVNLNVTTATCTATVLGPSAAVSTITWINTPIKLAGGTASGISVSSCSFFWKNTASAIATGTNAAIANLFLTGARAGLIVCDGVDFAGGVGIASGKNIVGALNSSSVVQVVNCKITSGALFATPPNNGAITDVIVTDSGATGYIQSRYTYQGTLTANTSVYNTATDGVTPISWQVVTTANAKRQSPFECFQIVQWAAAATYAASLIQITSATGSLLNSDVWVDVEYLASGSTPLASLVTSGPATQLTTGSALASGTWATGGLGNNYQLAIPSFTTALAGYVRFTVKVARASLTVCIDPAVTIA